jgi:hypothetical protein
LFVGLVFGVAEGWKVLFRTFVTTWTWNARGSMSGWRRVSGNSAAFSEVSAFLRMALSDSRECLIWTIEAS